EIREDRLNPIADLAPLFFEAVVLFLDFTESRRRVALLAQFRLRIIESRLQRIALAAQLLNRRDRFFDAIREARQNFCFFRIRERHLVDVLILLCHTLSPTAISPAATRPDATRAAAAIARLHPASANG